MSNRPCKALLSVLLVIITVLTMYGCGYSKSIALGDEISVGSVTRRYEVPDEETEKSDEEVTASAETTVPETSEEATTPVATTENTSNLPTTVYWTSGGKVWHNSESCPTLTRSNNIISGTVEQSGKSRGCSRCS